jgi:hypothetical protein
MPLDSKLVLRTHKEKPEEHEEVVQKGKVKYKK